MARLILSLLCIIFLNTWAGDEFSPAARAQTASAASRGTALARQVEARDIGRDARTALRMKLHDRRGRVRERALTVVTMRGGPGRPVDGDRTLIRFTYPNDIAGTGFLVWDHPDAEDERFLYLPSLGRTRRIAANETQESFVGSDFTYEDIGGREFDDYTYAILPATGAAAVWRNADGRAHRVQRLESTSRDPNARFPRIVSLVHTESLVIVGGEIYNRRDQVQKRFLVKRLERVGGYWTALELEMKDEIEGSRTELVLESVEYNVGLSPDAFTRRELERGRLP
ncbi:MAG TPA: outer membrane lipoprotein-sorting protein [Vicinamibacterales bacterium]|nr:outer membrane lipoprotein-sorting protein [Vicinamibacterales bacterium]